MNDTLKFLTAAVLIIAAFGLFVLANTTRNKSIKNGSCTVGAICILLAMMIAGNDNL